MLTKEQRELIAKEKHCTIIDDSNYKNLDSSIVVQCEHGHKFETTLSFMRRASFECPLCSESINFINPTSVPPKIGRRIIAFDQATENFGLSIFDNNQLVFYSLYTFSGTLAVRLVKITKFIRDIVLKYWQPDFIIFEDIQYEHNILTFKILAELIGIVTELCEENNVEYQIVSPNVWRRYAGTAGKTRKEEKILSVAKVKERYNINVTDDVAEAILIGQYAVKTHRQATFGHF